MTRLISAATMFVYSNFSDAAVSSSGNHDSNVYNMGSSKKHWGIKEATDKDGNSKFEDKIDKNSDFANKLIGHLLLVSGDMDCNLHPCNSLRVANALIKASQRFDFLFFPGRPHGWCEMKGAK